MAIPRAKFAKRLTRRPAPAGWDLRLKLQNDARATLLQSLAGGILLLGAYLTWRQLGIARRGQITDRYTRAVDQLGHAELDVRLGGIYALERIARDSPADRAAIGEVLTAFVRGHAPWPPSLSGQYVATAAIDEVPELRVRAADVQASLTVLGRGGFARPAGQGAGLDLHAVDLRHAHLGGIHLEGANLSGAQLAGAELFGAHLEGALLRGTHLDAADLHDAWLEKAVLFEARLEWADLSGVHLQGANLFRAHLERARLSNAHLEKANLNEARLEFTDLGGAHLEGALLRSAHLEWADLGGVWLQGAVADERTSWPEEFDWRAAGVMG